MADETSTIRQTAFIPAMPAEVYDAFVDPRKHAAFTRSGASGAPVVGGRYTACDDYISGEFLELIPGEKIVQSWFASEWPQGTPPSRLELTLRLKNGGTELVMVHSNVPARHAASLAQGWIDYYWSPLVEYFSSSVKPVPAPAMTPAKEPAPAKRAAKAAPKASKKEKVKAAPKSRPKPKTRPKPKAKSKAKSRAKVNAKPKSKAKAKPKPALKAKTKSRSKSKTAKAARGKSRAEPPARAKPAAGKKKSR